MMSYVMNGQEERSKNLRRSTIEHSSLKKVGFFVKRSLALHVTGNVPVGSIKRLNIKESFVIVVE